MERVSVDGARPVRLRRTWGARLASSGLQLLLTLYVAFTVAFVVLFVATGRAEWQYWYFYLLDVLLAALWLRGVTAWAEADDEGVRWRYWIRHEAPWGKVSRVALGERAVLFSPYPFARTRTPAIEIRARGRDEVYIRPAAAMGRRRREFGTQLLRLAREHGVRAEVTGGRWNEPVTRPEQPWA